MKRKLNKRSVALLVSLAVILTAAVSVTLAYIFTNTDALQNIFTPAQVKCAVVEKLDDVQQGGVTASQPSGFQTKSEVKIQNTGDTDAYIRVAIVVTWKKVTTDADGNKTVTVYAQAPDPSTDYTLEIGSDKWVKYGEYYYYTDVVPHDGNDVTEALIKSCVLKDGAVIPEGYQLSVEIVASAVQSAPSDTVGKAWGVIIAEKSVTEYTE